MLSRNYKHSFIKFVDMFFCPPHYPKVTYNILSNNNSPPFSRRGRGRLSRANQSQKSKESQFRQKKCPPHRTFLPNPYSQQIPAQTKNVRHRTFSDISNKNRTF